MTIKAKNIYYFSYINAIGGIESFYYYLGKKYKDLDIVIVYRNGDEKQLKRLKQFFNCIQYKNQTFECDKAFFNFNTDIIDSVKAKEYFLVLHGDYKAMIEQKQLSIKNLPLHPKIDKYIGVSKIACQSFKELTGIEPELCYNPILIDNPKKHKQLHFISATRLTKEKGKGRIIKMINALDKAGIDYKWTIFTDDINVIDNPHIEYLKPTLNIIDYINKADYLVQLSDNEGYCYSVIEALCCGTPVIVTPCPVFEELGLKNKENCFIIDFDMNNIPIKEIAENNLEFTYKPKEDHWGDIFEPGPSQYQKELHTLIEVIATSNYSDKNVFDAELEIVPKQGMKWYTNKFRAEMLKEKNFVTFSGKQKLDKEKKI